MLIMEIVLPCTLSLNDMLTTLSPAQSLKMFLHFCKPGARWAQPSPPPPQVNQ